MKLYDMDQQTRIDEFGVDHSNFSLRDEIDYNFRRAKEKEMQQSLTDNAYQNDYLGRMKAQQRVESRQNITPTHPDYTQPASLQFDGQNLIWLENGKPVKYYPAQSGHNGFQSAIYTNVPNDGPIPEGHYLLRKGTGQDYENDYWHKLRRYPPVSWVTTNNWTNTPAAWGQQRIPIQPQQGTNTFGRDSMYVHGGDNGFGSAGCIDLERGMPNFYQDWQAYDGDLSLEVKYPKGW